MSLVFSFQQFDVCHFDISHCMFLYVVNVISISCRYLLVYALGGSSIGHVYRLITDYEGYTLDFTG